MKKRICQICNRNEVKYIRILGIENGYDRDIVLVCQECVFFLEKEYIG